jgi:signal transduction histidine kinase
MFKSKLRTKLLLSLVLVSASLTWVTLLVVRHRVRLRVREEIFESLRNSVVTFQSLQRQRETTLERSATLLANLPPLKAVMTTQHQATIQDASADFWRLIGSELFVLADRSGTLMAIHTASPGFTPSEAQELLSRSLQNGEYRDWWYGGGRLFEIFIQPVYFGSPADNTLLGVLAIGYEINDRVAEDVSRVAASRVAFLYGRSIAVSTLSTAQQVDLARHVVGPTAADTGPEELQLDQERFLSTSVVLTPGISPAVTLSVLKSYDQATAFLDNLNRWILAVGVAAVLAGSVLVFLISTTFTRPLASLVAGVHALEKGDFAYPLEARGHDEVSELTAAFSRMRHTLQATQRELINAERLATIGRMASTISHDLRHPLTAILAYAEFLSEGNLDELQRKDFYQEIRLAVNRMTEQLSSLLGFSMGREALRPVYGSVEDLVERAIQTVQARPEFQRVAITFSREGGCDGWFDPSKLDRVLHNLLLNACEAVRPDQGRIEVSSRRTSQGLEIRVADNGAGIPPPIRDNLFQPFVSYGKDNGIGLGLTAAQKIMQDHGGQVSVESTGPEGSVFKLVLPLTVPSDKIAKE